MEALRFKPVAYYRLDDTTPLQDYSGYNRTATIVGTETHGVALTSEALYSQRFYTGNYGKFSAPVYVKGQESVSFSISITAYPIVTTAPSEQEVVSHPNKLDGITINGSVVNFSTAYSDGSLAKVSYDTKVIQKMNIVGVHTSEKNSLFINGKLVAEVEISEEQRKLQFDIGADTDFYCGYSSGTQRILVNSLGFYPRALRSDEILHIHNSNNRVAGGSVPKQYGGYEIPVGSETRPAFIDRHWADSEEWNSGYMSNSIVDEDSLVAQTSAGVTLAGEWYSSVNLYNGSDATPINSINFLWEGLNETVEVSLDNSTWTAIQKGVNVPIIPTGFNPQDKTLFLRVRFEAGKEEAYIDFLRVRGYISNTAVSSGTTITYTNPAAMLEEEPVFEMKDTFGVRLSTGAMITIPVEGVRTIEVWMKPSETKAATFGGTPYLGAYENGDVAADTTMNEGEWVLYHRTLNTSYTGNVEINVAGLIGKVSFYPTVITAAQAAAIYKSYTGTSVSRYDGSATINVTEPPASTDMYAHDWEIVTA